MTPAPELVQQSGPSESGLHDSASRFKTPVLDQDNLSERTASRSNSESDGDMTAQVATPYTQPSSSREQRDSSPRSLDMKKEVDRLQTFSDYNWPGPIAALALAHAGFYYFGESDHVRCAFCHNDCGKWEPSDDPIEEHRRHFPYCRFIRGIDVGNVPRPGTSNPVEYAPDEAGHDVCGVRPIMRPFSGPEQSVLPKGSKVKKGADLKKLGVIHMQPAQAPHLCTKEARMQTYKLWPRGLKQKPQVLADAGFYYTGMGDRVKCFHCDGGLADWEDDDDPWEEHARWFSRCSFLLQIKGQQYVDEVLKKKQPILKPLEDESPKGEAPTEKMDIEEKHSAETPKESNSVEDTKEEQSGELRLCRVCLEEERGMVFLPCGHFVCCTKCGPLLDKCPVCRQAIEASVRTFLS